MRTLTISPNNVVLRFFEWVWEVKIEKINICKLFWGYILFPAGVVSKKSKLPFGYLSPFGALELAAAVAFAISKNYHATVITIGFVFLSLLYNYLYRDRIKEKLIREKVEMIIKEAERKTKESEIAELPKWAEKILDVVFQPIFFVIDLWYKVFNSRPGERITGVLSLLYHAGKSFEQKTCLLIRVEK